MNHKSPFVYGRPVDGNEFANRTEELGIIYGRLGNRESTAIIGEPHIGKTSLLLRLIDQKTIKKYLNKKANQYIFIYRDLHGISENYSVQEFWQDALAEIVNRNDEFLAESVGNLILNNYRGSDLRVFFDSLKKRDIHLVLLLDEFERLVYHTNFRNAEFWGLLRGLSSVHGLVLVIASRQSIDTMQKSGRSIIDIGSSFFNTLIPITLRPFSPETVSGLLMRGKNRKFTPKDVEFICRWTGAQPFLVQALASNYPDPTVPDRQMIAAEKFYDMVAFHFDDVWSQLDDASRTAVILLSLVELKGRAIGLEFNYSEIEKVDAFGPELKRLEKIGLAEKINNIGIMLDWDNFLIWRGERWRIGSIAFAWWIRDVVIAESREVLGYSDWLMENTYDGLLTVAQRSKIRDQFKKVPPKALQSIGELARSFLEGLLKKGT